ncbi:S-ribosylhomocysteine lyase [Oribacterium sp. WCC10]|uniref:S-ribosylhomocysteine lyase n=1 Tax=Oribacterium sp. WCC10 TaxID=1855343 RepID=UPI0008E188BE|nr:S-ribosylhomocysteine lyase [Oribacterium sp. WCC10]SFG21674.1 S-ribosylhomocysteine lyase /quorum-sensing autoinducer 2 (AI-2) synthesis protein LuxS [Oribacterium sp. WCC10]
MELIQSFSVDHTRIVPGIFTSRVDHLGDYSVTTYDVRLKRPNREPVIDVAAMHSLEHIIATCLRNDPDWKDEVIYWGPMGCLTGFYLILKGDRTSKEVFDLILRSFKSVNDTQVVPGTTPENCGYYRMHNLDMAKWYANEFVSYLEANAENDDIYEYPKTERLVTDDGQHFFDS